jgi:hypothetical protein
MKAQKRKGSCTSKREMSLEIQERIYPLLEPPAGRSLSQPVDHNKSIVEMLRLSGFDISPFPSELLVCIFEIAMQVRGDYRYCYGLVDS